MFLCPEWMKKELENGKLCARATMVISGHSLYPTDQDALAKTSNNEHATSYVAVPEQVGGDFRTVGRTLEYWALN